MKEEKIKKRESNMELLRIISMLMIVFHHFAIHGDFIFNNNLSINNLWYTFISMGGKLGVNIFILISGYFLVNKKEIKFNFKHIFKFIFQVLFYSIVILFVYTIISKNHITLKKLKETLLPITFEKWWFASTYFILYLLHPFINKVLLGLNKKEYQKLLIIIITCFSIIPTFLNKTFQKGDLIWFICLYIIAGYIKLHGLPKKIKNNHYFLMFSILLLLVYLSTIGILPLKKYLNIYTANKTTTLLLSITLFMTFNKLKIKQSKFINLIASSTFGVYLIHDEPSVRHFIWPVLFKNASYQDSNLLIPYSIIVCLFIYIICTIIELIRKKMIEKPVLEMIDMIKQKE